ncbi:MAG: membrane protein insertion efficiency factor YidD [Sphingobacteriales bacterium]|nr:MAG: membrane protein insertion efficiency factor YidD [Sphingobacteriales bacterium]
MLKYNLFLFIFLNHFFLSAQITTESVDGELIKSKQLFLANNVKHTQTSTNDYINIYQKYISGIRGQQCPMYPSCSNFGLKTFSEKSFAEAFVLTSDRLLRCGHEPNKYDLTIRPNGFKFIDYPAYQNAPIELYYTKNTYSFSYSDKNRDDSTLLFIKKLLNNHYYREALLEIMRVEYNYPAFNIELFTNKIICYKALGEYENALFDYETKCPLQYKNYSELAFQIALIQFKLKNFDQALQKNQTALDLCNDEYCKSKILLLKGVLYANKYEWEKSMQTYETLSVLEPYKKLADINLKLAESGTRIKFKNPRFASLISIIPGAGYAYAGHKQTAISAFLVNGLLAYATYTSLKNKNYGMGLLTGVFNLSFYIGNIYGASKSAKRYNEQKRKSIIDKLEFNSNL